MGRFEPLARGRGRSMVSTGREWLHRVDSCPSGPMSQRRGSADSGRYRAAREPAGPVPWLPVIIEDYRPLRTGVTFARRPEAGSAVTRPMMRHRTSIGIDFGTTNTVVAIAKPGEPVRALLRTNSRRPIRCRSFCGYEGD